MRQFVFGIRPNESHYFRPAILTNPFLEIFKNNVEINCIKCSRACFTPTLSDWTRESKQLDERFFKEFYF